MSSAATWGANEYRTNRFIKNHVECISCTGDDNVTRGLKELGQSPIGQKLFGTIADFGRKLDIWIGSETSSPRYYADLGILTLPSSVDFIGSQDMGDGQQLATADMATVIAHELGHYENRYRGWIGTPERITVKEIGDVPMSEGVVPW